MIFIRVDLPAPFSPMTAWISPRATAKLTSSSARTPPKDLPMASIRRKASSGTRAALTGEDSSSNPSPYPLPQGEGEVGGTARGEASPSPLREELGGGREEVTGRIPWAG